MKEHPEYLRQLPEEFITLVQFLESLKSLGYLMNRLGSHVSNEPETQYLLASAALEIEEILKSIISLEK